jgi:hypothetical protein
VLLWFNVVSDDFSESKELQKLVQNSQEAGGAACCVAGKDEFGYYAADGYPGQSPKCAVVLQSSTGTDAAALMLQAAAVPSHSLAPHLLQNAGSATSQRAAIVEPLQVSAKIGCQQPSLTQLIL